MIINNPIDINKWQFTNSQVSTFKNCRQKFYWNYLELLSPKRLVKPLYFGRLIHEVIELYYTYKSHDVKIEDIKGHAQNYIFKMVEEQRAELDNAYEGSNEDMDKDLDDIENDAIAISNHYIDYAEKNDDFSFVKPEQAVNLTLEIEPGFSINVKAKLDGEVQRKSDNTFWLLEHKTTASKNFDDYIAKLLLDDQVNLYLMLYRKQFPEKEIKGTMYNIIRKKVPTIPRLLKNGSISKDKSIDTTYDIFLEALEDNKQDQAEYTEILDKLKHNEFMRREYQFRTDDFLKIFWQEWCETLKALTSPKILIYKNPSACKMMKCSYYSLCVEDTKENRDFNFTKRSDLNPEYIEQEEENKSEWS